MQMQRRRRVMQRRRRVMHAEEEACEACD